MISTTLLRSALLAALCTTTAASTTFSSRNALSSLFGVRGGALFGGGKKEDAKDEDAKKYPAMTKEEVEEWLSHIPVFAVTDKNGQGVVLRPNNETAGVFHFYMSPLMANNTMTQLQSFNEDMELQIAAFSLGKIWFSILNAESNPEVKIKEVGAEDGNVTKKVEYHLIPDAADLLGARMLLTMDPEDGEAIQKEGALTPEAAQKAIKKAMTESPKFKNTHNEIPIFLIGQMRMVKQPPEGEEMPEEPETMTPIYFSLKQMVSVWQQFSSQTEEAKNVEPSINVMDLFELVQKLQEESEVDFRNCLLIPPTPAAAGPGADGARSGMAEAMGGADASETGEMKMPGATLGDL